jgi:hypothetical protein
MYSPKIAEDLIPVLYRMAKGKNIPMTRLVDAMIRESVTKEENSKVIAFPNDETLDAV